MPRIALLLLLATGCVTTTYDTGLPPSGSRHEQSANYFLWGLVGDKTVDLAAVCPEGVSSFRDYRNAGDAALHILTCGIYAPLTIEVECAGQARTAFLLVPEPAAHRTWVLPRSAEGRP